MYTSHFHIQYVLYIIYLGDNNNVSCIRLQPCTPRHKNKIGHIPSNVLARSFLQHRYLTHTGILLSHVLLLALAH
jgi:hypothetical protein